MKKLVTLFLLYFVQAAPYGFQAGCLPLILRQNGLSFTDLGVMKLLFLPWVLKPLFTAPVERNKYKWLVGSLVCLGFTCVAAGIFTSPRDMTQLSVVLITLNLFSAVQDICVDCFAVKLLDVSELGVGNTIQVVGYKFGGAVADAALLTIENRFGWAAMFLCLSYIYFLCVFCVITMNLVPKDASILKSATATTTTHDTWAKFIRTMVPGTRWTLLYVTIYKLSERGLGLFPVYLLDKGVSTDSLAIGSALSRIFSIAGSTYAGYLLLNQTPFRVTFMYSVGQIFPFFIHFLLIGYWTTDKVIDWTTKDDFMTVFGYIVLSWNLFCSGVITTSCFTIMMRLSQTVTDENLQGFHFSFLCTFEIVGKLLFASVAGKLGDVLGLQVAYILFTTLAAINVPLILKAPLSVTTLF